MMYEIFSACGKKLPVNWLVGRRNGSVAQQRQQEEQGEEMGGGVFTMRVNILLCGNTVTKNSESTFISLLFKRPC